MLDEELIKKLEEKDRKLEQESNRYIVQFEQVRGKDIKVLSREFEQDGEILMTFHRLNAVAINVKPESVSKVTKLHKTKGTYVKNVWKDRRVRIALDKSIPLILANKVWNHPDGGNSGVGIVIAVIDTGVDTDHPDLKGRVLKTEDFTEEGYFDGNGHGTHVAGTIAGNGEASAKKYVGVAPEASIIAAKVLDSNGSGWLSGVIAGVEWSGDNGAQIANLSLGGSGPCDGTDPMCLAVDILVDEGIVVCVAAGNAGPESKTVGTPGCAKNVITIGASDDNDKIAFFSSRGPTADGRIKPDLCFPGVNIIAPRANNTSMGSPLDQYYTSASGTSMATPHAAGTAALLLAKNLDLKPKEVMNLLTKHAKDMSYEANTQGSGRGDVLKSFEDTGEENGGDNGSDQLPYPPIDLRTIAGVILFLFLAIFLIFVVWSFFQ